MIRQVARLQRRAKRAITTGEPPVCGGPTYVFGTGVEEINGYVGSGDYDQIYEPGAVLEITAGNRGRLRFRHIHGTAECPITIRNSSGGAVVFTSLTQTGLNIQNCRHVHIDGTGAAGVTYGFQATAANNTKAIEIGKRSIHVEMNNVEFANCSNIGLFVHTNDDAGFDYEETTPGTPSAYSGPKKWVDEDYLFYDMLGHDIGNVQGEGAYIGNNNAQIKDRPDMTNMVMHDVQIDRTAFESFDFKAMDNGDIYDIQTDDSGQVVSSHEDGIHFGTDFGGKVRDATVTNCRGHGVNMQQSYRTGELDNVNVDAPGGAGYKFQPVGAVETDDGILIMRNCTLTNPSEDGLKFTVSLVDAAAACIVEDNVFNYNTGDDCIQVSEEPIGTETGNTCNAV